MDVANVIESQGQYIDERGRVSVHYNYMHIQFLM